MKMEKRGLLFLEDRISITNLLDLFKPSQLRDQFEKEVVGETSRKIEQQTGSIVDWMLSKNSKLWNQVMHQTQSAASMQSSLPERFPVGKQFEYNRQELIDSLARQSVQVVENFDPKKESQIFIEQIRNALLATVVVESSLGLGALITFSLLDFTGAIGLGVAAVLGFGILPLRRVTLKSKFEKKLSDLRNTLKDTVSTHFEEELKKSVNKIEAAVRPFSQFVKQEEKTLAILSSDLIAVKKELDDLQEQISQEF